MRIHRQLLLALTTIVAVPSLALGGEVQGKIAEYGIIKAPTKSKLVNTPETASGTSNHFLQKPTVELATERIPAKLGLRFGANCEITDLPVEDGYIVELLRVTKCPPMRKPDGTIYTGSELKVRRVVRGGRVDLYSGFGFDNEYELVPGTWTFEIRLGNKTLCKQEFTVSRE